MSSSRSPHPDEPTEHSPLLAPPSRSSTSQDRDGKGQQQQDDSSSSIRDSRRWRWLRLPTFDTTHPRFRFVPLVGCLVILTNEAEFFFKQAASMRAVESLCCIEYYNVHDPSLARELGRHIPERLCKVDEIEKSVARIWAMAMLVRMLSSMVVTLPLGRLADRGRRRVMTLHKLSTVITSGWGLIVYLAYPVLPVWSFPLGGFASLIGGNFDLGIAVMFAAYADVVPDPAQRTALFFLTTSMQYVGQAVCPPIGGALMNLDGKGGTVTVALAVGILAGVMSLSLVAFCFPETLEKTSKRSEPISSVGEAETNGSSRQEEEDNESPRASLARNLPSRLFKGVKSSFRSWTASVSEGLTGLGVLNTLTLAFSMLLVTIGIKAIDWYGLLQYPVVRLGWSYSRASSIPSLQAIVTITLFFLLLPLLTPHLAPLHIMILSLLFLLSGAILLGLSSTAPFFLASMALYTLGAGFTVTAQSYIATRIAPRNLGKVLSALSLAAMAGKVAASAVWPVALAWGLDAAARGAGEWVKGTPMFLFAAGFAGAGVGIVLVALRERREGKVSMNDEEGVHGDGDEE